MTYYIDPLGNNGDTGGIGDPWLTLTFACTQAVVSGDIIHINPGTYTEVAQSNLAVGVSIEGEGATSIIESALAWGDHVATIRLFSAAEGTNGNQTISGINVDGTDTTWGAILVIARSNVRIYDCDFVDFDMTGVTFGGKVILWNPLVEPVIYATGNQFYNNTITNCADRVLDGAGLGGLQIGGQDGILIHDSTFTQISRAEGRNGYPIKYFNGGFNRGIKIYDNTITAEAPINRANYWNFGIELWSCRGGVEIYDNIFYGSVDLSGATNTKGAYDFAFDIHDNTIGYAALQTHSLNRQNAGVFIERGQEGPVRVHHNKFRNVGTPIQIYPTGTDAVNNISIYTNIFNGIGTIGQDAGQYLVYGSTVDGFQNTTADNWNFWNNTIYVGDGAIDQGIYLPNIGDITNVSIRNNIIQGVTNFPVYSNLAGGTIDILSIENNDFYDNGTDAPLHAGIAPTNNTTQNNLTDNPEFIISGTNFHLQEGSPAISAGLDVGLETDYDGIAWRSPPSIGAYEIPPVPPTPPIHSMNCALDILTIENIMELVTLCDVEGNAYIKIIDSGLDVADLEDCTECGMDLTVLNILKKALAINADGKYGLAIVST